MNDLLFPLSPATPSLQWREPLLGAAPAPAGALFVLGADGGCAAVPRDRNEVSIGRDRERVHVTVGADDLGVSREHATIRYHDSWWTLHNKGQRPIHIPQAPPLLPSQDAPLNPGYTTLYIESDRLHAVEVLVSRGPSHRPPAFPNAPTRDDRVPLSDVERLVLVAMYQDYLHRSTCARPLTRNEARDALNNVPGQAGWTHRMVEHVVHAVRERLTAAGEPGFDKESAHAELLRINLIHHLLNTGSLVPADLELLDGPRPVPDNSLR